LRGRVGDIHASEIGQRQAKAPRSGWKRVSMIRSELLQALCGDNPDLRPEEIEQVVDIFFDEISARLAEGGRVELRGFGTFSTRKREARTGRNPRTGDSVNVPEKYVPYFKPGKEMRERLNSE
jgi:integration host factor subunit beta